MVYLITNSANLYSYFLGCTSSIEDECRITLQLLDLTTPTIKTQLHKELVNDSYYEPPLCIFVFENSNLTALNSITQIRELRGTDLEKKSILLNKNPLIPPKNEFSDQQNLETESIAPADIYPQSTVSLYRMLTDYFYSNCIVLMSIPPAAINDSGEALLNKLRFIIEDFMHQTQKLSLMFEQKTDQAAIDNACTSSSDSFHRVCTREQLNIVKQYCEKVGNALHFTFSMKHRLKACSCRAAFFSFDQVISILEQYQNAIVLEKYQAKTVFLELLAYLEKIFTAMDLSL